MDEFINRAHEQLQKEIRVATDGDATRMRRNLTDDNRELYDFAVMQNDVAQIDRILRKKDLNISEVERVNLEAIQGRNISSLLVLSEKVVGDSKAMKAVKKSISKIEVYIEKENKNAFTEADIDELLSMYDEAITNCRNYCIGKDPTYQKGKDRKRRVMLNLKRLLDESAAYRVAKELIHSGMMDGKSGNAHQLLVQAKLYMLTKPDQNEAVAEERPEAKEEDVKALGLIGEHLYSALSGREEPSDLIDRLKKSKNEDEQKLASALPVLISSFRRELANFSEGKAASKVFFFDQTVFSLTQNAAGQLTLAVGNKSVPLERYSGVLADQLSVDIVKNPDVYGEAEVNSVIRGIVEAGSAEFEVNYAAKLQLVTTYLAKQTGRAASKFHNVSPRDLFQMTKYALNGNKQLASMTKHLLDGDYDAAEMVNGVETKELIKEAAKKEKLADVKSKVIILKNENKQADPANEDWQEKEGKIMKLLGDMIFSYDTWNADALAEKPGERMKKVLMKHHEAMAELIADMYRSGEDRLKIIHGILDRLPLFALEDDAQIAKFKNMITENVKKITEKIDKKIADTIAEQLPEILKKKEEIKVRRDQREEMKKKAEAEKKKREEESGGGIFGLFGNLLGKGVDYAAEKAIQAAEKVDSEMEKALDQVDSYEKLYDITIKHLQNTDALINGDAKFPLPTIKDIINGMEIEELADEEHSIEDSVEDMTEKIQGTVKKYSGELFKPEKKQQNNNEPLPDPNAPGLEDYERRNAKRKLIKLGNDKLTDKMKEALASGESGQGMFTKFVFEQYFANVDMMDKRCMIASMLKNSKPVTEKLLNEKEDNISEEEKKRRSDHNEKIRKKAMGNYLGGLLKGAGPLFQKMMQGLPTDGLPEELKGAVEDMKSKLSPIPEEVVEAQLYNMVQNSHKQIKSITVVKPLGAASVGQTFLCKITKADGKEEEVAIKLLKPDVRNRMMREKKIMLECAHKTDVESRKKENERRKLENRKLKKAGKPELKLLPEIKENEKGGMQVTYEGQLARIEEELDLTIEARNVELGKVYDKYTDEKSKKAESMKLNKLIAPTTNSMVLEKAPGETVDTLLKRIHEEVDEIIDIYKQRGEDGKVLMRELEDGKKEVVLYNDTDYAVMGQGMEENHPDFKEAKKKIDPRHITEKLMRKLMELQKKKEYLEAYAKKWVEEGVFKEGFYHGDPHAGNIMISDDKLTVIDFGNCTKLSKDQQLHVTRMLFAASVGDMKTFRSGFHALLNPKFEQLYQEKREELGRIISETFALGDAKSAGPRIMVALLRAQELGLEVPAAVYNFSQGQMRLQNTIADFNTEIEQVKKLVLHFQKLPGVADSGFDFTDKNKEEWMRKDDKEPLTSSVTGYAVDMLNLTSDKEAIKTMTSIWTETVSQLQVEPMRRSAENMDEAIQTIETLSQSLLKFSPKLVQRYQIGEVNAGIRSIAADVYNLSEQDIQARKQEWSAKVIRQLAKIDAFVDEDKKQRIIRAIDHVKQGPEELNDALSDISENADNSIELEKPTDEKLAQEFTRVKNWKNELDAATAKVIGIMGEQFQKDMDALFINKLTPENVKAITDKMRQLKAQAKDAVKKYDKLLAKKRSIESSHHGTFIPNKKERAAYDKLVDEFTDAFFPVQQNKTIDCSTMTKYFNRILYKDERNRVKADMERFFAVYTYRKDDFEKAYREYGEAQDAGMEKLDPEKFEEIELTLKKVYLDIMQRVSTQKFMNCKNAIQGANDTFVDIMGNVIDEQKSTSIKRLGVITSGVYSYKFNAIRDEQEELKANEEEDQKLV